MPTVARRVLTALALLAVVVGLEFGFATIIPDPAWRQLALFAMVNVIVALSLNVINGMAGQFSIGHAGFVGVGAYTAAVVASHLHYRLYMAGLTESTPLFKWSFLVMPAALVAAGALAGLFGVLVGLPSLRLRGDYLAIVTLGFAEIFRLVIATAQTGGAAEGGLSGMLARLGGQNGYDGVDTQGAMRALKERMASLSGAELDQAQEALAKIASFERGVPQYAGPFWIFGALVLATLVAWRLKFSGWGRALRALREDEIASAAVGVDPTQYKVKSFVIAAVGAGMAGALLASMRDGNPTVQPDQFTFAYSFDAITMVILGGSGSVSGAIVGGLFVTFTVKFIEQLQGLESVQALKTAWPWLDLNALRMVVYAAVLITLMILRPEGLFGERELFRRRRAKQRVEKGGAEPVPAATRAEAAGKAVGR